MSAWHRWIALGLLLTGCDIGQPFLTLPFFQPHGGGSPVDAGPSNRPPELLVVFVAPLQTGVGSSITLSAEAWDPDGDRLTYHWTGTGGQIKKPHAAETTYVCKEEGTHAVAVVVRDEPGLTAVSVADIVCAAAD